MCKFILCVCIICVYMFVYLIYVCHVGQHQVSSVLRCIFFLRQALSINLKLSSSARLATQ